MWNERLSSRQFLCTYTRRETVVAVFSQSLPEVLVKLVSSGVALCQPLIFHPWQKLHDSMVPRKDWWTASSKMLINTLFLYRSLSFFTNKCSFNLARPRRPSSSSTFSSSSFFCRGYGYTWHLQFNSPPPPIKGGGGGGGRCENNSKWDSNTKSSRPCHFWSHRYKCTRVWKQIKGMVNVFFCLCAALDLPTLVVLPQGIVQAPAPEAKSMGHNTRRIRGTKHSREELVFQHFGGEKKKNDVHAHVGGRQRIHRSTPD